VNIQRDYTEKQHRRDDLLTGTPYWLLWYLDEHLGDVPETLAPQMTAAEVLDRGFYGPPKLSPWDTRAWR
jgi:hypothetical protein